MSAQEVLIGNAIVAELNDPARSWAPLEVPSELQWDPWFTDEEVRDGRLDLLQVLVVPTAIPKGERLDRSGLKTWEYEVWLEFQKKVPLANGRVDTATVNTLCAFVQAVQTWFDTNRGAKAHELTTLAGWCVLKTERPLVYDAESLYSQQIFESAVKLTIQGFR